MSAKRDFNLSITLIFNVIIVAIMYNILGTDGLLCCIALGIFMKDCSGKKYD